VKRRPGSCRTIVVEKTDRLYRDIRDWVTLDELGPDIHFVKEATILSSDSRSLELLTRGIKVSMAKNVTDYYLSEEVRTGMPEKAEEGIWRSRAPFGYRNVMSPYGKEVIEPRQDIAPLILQLFEWHGSGRYSLSHVTQMAHEAGLCQGGAARKRLLKTTIHRLLRNPLHQGDICWDGRTYPGMHEPIVSRELFARVQDVLMGKPGKHRRRRRDFAFAGLIVCRHYGGSVTAEIKKERHVYYHCTGYRGKCGEPFVREDVLEAQFTGRFGELWIEPEVLA
jgi:site-specific DNA recombinase